MGRGFRGYPAWCVFSWLTKAKPRRGGRFACACPVDAPVNVRSSLGSYHKEAEGMTYNMLGVFSQPGGPWANAAAA